MADKTRVKHHWRVTLQNRAGRTIERDVFAYWNPEDVTTPEAVAAAARIEASRELKVEHQAIGTPELVT